jgi:hypothetical protein
MHWRERAERAEAQLAGPSKLEMAGDENGVDIFQLNIARIRYELPVSILIPVVKIQDDVYVADFMPAWLEDSSSKDETSSAVIVESNVCGLYNHDFSHVDGVSREGP